MFTFSLKKIYDRLVNKIFIYSSLLIIESTKKLDFYFCNEPNKLSNPLKLKIIFFPEQVNKLNIKSIGYNSLKDDGAVDGKKIV